jgi:glycosyltransferase involved in cell wall biosynthesis
MNKKSLDNASVLVKLKDRGVKMAVVTSRSLGLKGVRQLPPYENMDGVPVYRLFRNPLDMLIFPQRRLKAILAIARDLHTDLIFCSQEMNIRLALLIKRYVKVPVTLLVEDAGFISSNGAGGGGLAARFILHILGIPTGREFWQWLSHNTSAIITCHPRDLRNLRRLSCTGKRVYYVPWPTYLPDGFKPPPSKIRHRAVYVGSLYPFKNTQEFRWTLPRILKETQTKEFIVVGPGPHARIIKKLQRSTHGAVKYIQQLPRDEALSLIASSFYGYTPVKRGGWGFIGDCWSTKTPVILTHNDDYVTDDVNALVAGDDDELIQKINRLYEAPELFEKLQKEGHNESEKRRSEIVSDKLYGILAEVIGT